MGPPTIYSHHGAWLWNNWCQPLLEKCISRRQWKGLWRNEIPQRGKSQPSYLWTVDGFQQRGDTDIPLLSRFCSANGLLTPENRLRHFTCSTGHLSASLFCKFFFFLKVAFPSQHFNFVRLKMWHFQQSLPVQTQSRHVSQLLTVIWDKNWISGEFCSFWTGWDLVVGIMGWCFILYNIYIALYLR